MLIAQHEQGVNCQTESDCGYTATSGEQHQPSFHSVHRAWRADDQHPVHVLYTPAFVTAHQSHSADVRIKPEV
jgi:hypothetical protein